MRLRRQEYPLAYPLLLGLIERTPERKTYWVQASSVALSSENYDSATALLQLAQNGNLLTEAKEIRSLAGLLIVRGIPYRAAQLLQQAIADQRLSGDAENYELLGNCWVAARDYDKAVEPLNRAGELAATGEPFLRLAEVYAQQENWPGAVEALRHGIDKGNLKRPGLALLLMGMAHFNQKKLPDARTWFERAAAHPEQKTQAEAWLAHTEKAIAARAGAS
jgi:tetratricopeptide (TPR) repeat protein